MEATFRSPPRPALQHAGEKAAGQCGYRADVHVNGGQLFRDRNILKAACSSDSSIVDQVINGQAISYCGIGDLVGGFAIGEIGRDDGGSHSTRAGPLGDRVERAGMAANQDQVRATLRQQVGKSGPDPARCAGDECGGPSEEITHGAAGNI